MYFMFFFSFFVFKIWVMSDSKINTLFHSFPWYLYLKPLSSWIKSPIDIYLLDTTKNHHFFRNEGGTVHPPIPRTSKHNYNHRWSRLHALLMAPNVHVCKLPSPFTIQHSFPKIPYCIYLPNAKVGSLELSAACAGPVSSRLLRHLREQKPHW